MESPLSVLSYTVDGNYSSNGRVDKQSYTIEPDFVRRTSVHCVSVVKLANYQSRFQVRPSLLVLISFGEHADQILVLNKGQIVQQGRHSEFMKQTGIYRKFILGSEETVGWKI